MFYNEEKANLLKRDLLNEIKDVSISILFEIHQDGEFLFFVVFINDENDLDKVDYLKNTIKNYLGDFLPSHRKNEDGKNIDFRWFVNIYFDDELIDTIAP